MTQIPLEANLIHDRKPQAYQRDPLRVALFLHGSEGVLKKISRKAYNFRCSLIKVYSGVTQFFSWFLFWPLYNLLFKIKIHGRENLRGLKGPLIMASNHSRFYDSFLYRIIVGLFNIKMLPMRFMATIKFSDAFMSMIKKTGIIHFVYSLFGVFVIEQGLGLNKNLKRAKDILKNKGVVAMFPEGRLNKNGEVLMFKRGISALALSTHTKVLPMHIDIKRGNLWRLRRGSITVNIGKAHYLETHSTYEELAEGLRQEVIALGNL